MSYGNGDAVGITLPFTHATWVVGMALRLTGYNTFRFIILLADNGNAQFGLCITNTGALQGCRGGLAATVGPVSTNVLSLNTWYFVEFKCTINNTTGSFEARVNGTSTGWLPPLTNQNTRQTANNSANGVQVGASQDWNYPSSNGTTGYIDDVYALDGAGTVNNDFLGDVRVETLYPTGAGNYAQWAPVGAAANWDCTNDPQANDDTDYTSSYTLNQIDTYTIADLSAASAAIPGVQINTLLRKDNAGSRTVAPLLRSGGTDYPQANIAVLDSYAYNLQMLETKPAGGAWDDTTVNGIEAGVKLIA